MASVQLDVKVSNLKGVKGYACVFRGNPLLMTNDTGQITWDSTKTEWLAWHMVGDPSGTMDVKVLRGATVISQRIKSRIPNSRPAGFDEIPIPQAGLAAAGTQDQK